MVFQTGEKAMIGLLPSRRSFVCALVVVTPLVVAVDFACFSSAGISATLSLLGHSASPSGTGRPVPKDVSLRQSPAQSASSGAYAMVRKAEMSMSSMFHMHSRGGLPNIIRP